MEKYNIIFVSWQLELLAFVYLEFDTACTYWLIKKVLEEKSLPVTRGTQTEHEGTETGTNTALQYEI